MIKKPYKMIGVLVILLSICSCKINTVHLDEKEKQILQFEELPMEIGNQFKSSIMKRVGGEFGETFIFINLDSYNVEFEQKTMDNSFFETVVKGGTYYYFKINRKLFDLRANLGDPFIIKDSCLYYPNKFSAGREEYKTVSYTRICFREDLI